MVTRRGAVGRPGRVPGLSGLNEDQADDCDWSKALSTPQPKAPPVLSLTSPTFGAGGRAAQSRSMPMLCVVVAFAVIATSRTTSVSKPAAAKTVSFG